MTQRTTLLLATTTTTRTNSSPADCSENERRGTNAEPEEKRQDDQNRLESVCRDLLLSKFGSNQRYTRSRFSIRIMLTRTMTTTTTTTTTRMNRMVDSLPALTPTLYSLSWDWVDRWGITDTTMFLRGGQPQPQTYTAGRRPKLECVGGETPLSHSHTYNEQNDTNRVQETDEIYAYYSCQRLDQEKKGFHDFGTTCTGGRDGTRICDEDATLNDALLLVEALVCVPSSSKP